MMEKDKAIDITEEDIKDVMKELKTYLDITEKDLKRIYILALEQAKKRLLKKKSAKEIREGYYEKGGSVCQGVCGDKRGCKASF